MPLFFVLLHWTNHPPTDIMTQRHYINKNDINKNGEKVTVTGGQRKGLTRTGLTRTGQVTGDTLLAMFAVVVVLCVFGILGAVTIHAYRSGMERDGIVATTQFDTETQSTEIPATPLQVVPPVVETRAVPHVVARPIIPPVVERAPTPETVPQPVAAPTPQTATPNDGMPHNPRLSPQQRETVRLLLEGMAAVVCCPNNCLSVHAGLPLVEAMKQELTNLDPILVSRYLVFSKTWLDIIGSNRNTQVTRQEFQRWTQSLDRLFVCYEQFVGSKPLTSRLFIDLVPASRCSRNSLGHAGCHTICINSKLLQS